MYIITNREINNKKSGLDIFGKKPNTAKGAQEITIVEVKYSKKSWVAKPVDDKISKEELKKLKDKYNLDIDDSKTWHGSLRVACDIFASASKSKKCILFFIHGYNNDVEDVVKAAQAIEALYDVIVVPISWPANGGNPITGTASYLSDKADARLSTYALNRIIGKIGLYHSLLTKSNLDRIKIKAFEKHPDDNAKARALITKTQERECKTKLSLLCHSMGNYLLKHTLLTSDSETKKLVFDNICLVAADANNKDHKNWVGKLDVRNRCYVVINENDSALKASRIKPGDEQLARLGHYLKKLNSENAYYIDFTNAKGVGSEHTYFKGDTIEKNLRLKKIFKDMFNGQEVEQKHKLIFKSDNNTYILNN